jgi:ankyrin repeat protein
MVLLVGAYLLQGNGAWAMEHRIAGKTAKEVFKAPHLSDLANAACDGDRRAVSAAIAAGADPNGLSVDGGTPLLWAVYCNNPRGVEALLRAGANPNYKVRGKYSSTFAAATSVNSEVLRLLLANGGDPNADDGGQWTALRLALMTGVEKHSWDNYYALLNNSKVDLNRKNSAGQTIAEYAVSEGQFDKVAELLERGYSNDLLSLGGGVQVRRVAPADPQYAWKEKVIAILKQRGVQFPVPPLHGKA